MSKRAPRLDVRDRILARALQEFSRRGYAGARVDRIARLARVSKRMLFYYFKNKQALFAQVMESAWQNGRVAAQAPSDPIGSVRFWREFYFKNEAWLRLMIWESLERAPAGVMDKGERRRVWSQSVEKIAGATGPGGWPAELSPEYILIAGLGMISAPLLLPTVVRLTTDMDPHEPRFVAEYARTLERMIQLIIRASPEALAGAGGADQIPMPAAKR
jgi:AcrR family transcriptional regulator